MKHSLKAGLIIVFILFTCSNFAQLFILNYDDCHDIKIISGYTNDTLNRCDLFVNKEKTLKALGSRYELSVEDGMFGISQQYRIEQDYFSYRIENDLVHASFSIFSTKYQLLIDNQYYFQVGKKINEFIEKYKPNPTEHPRNINAIVINFLSDPDNGASVKYSSVNIVFDEETKEVTKIKCYTKPGI